MDKQYCEHTETGAIGVIKEEMNNYNPPQYGIFWTENANHSKYGNHYYWNDKQKIKINDK